MFESLFKKPLELAICLPLILGLLFLAACQPFKTLEYRGLSDWDFQTKSFAESKLAVNVVVFNPNKHKIVVKRMEADIEVNGQKWSNYKMDSTFEVPGNAEFTFPVVLIVKNSYLLSGMSGIASGKELPYLFKGKIRGMYRSITAEVPFTYAGSFSNKDIKL